MSYIGAEPNTVFRVAPVKDTFTGDGSTVAFDLANSVPAGGENALQVFVENVRQEPGSGKAYTLGADGSGDLKRITFSAAPVSSAEIYVITSFSNEAFVNNDIKGSEFVLDADGDTSITADTDDQIDIKIAGADDFKFSANAFNVLSGSTLTIDSGATITNSGTANGFGSAADDITTGDAAVTIATSSGNITIDAQGGDTDIIFKGTDGSSDITPLTLDMSDGGKALFTGGITMTGTTPTLTIGDAGEEDTKIVFDGNAQDFHIGLDDSADSLTIGLGSTLGTTSHMVIDATGAVTKPLQPAFLALNDGGMSITNATTTTIHLDTEIFDNNGDVTNHTFTAPVTGKYYLAGLVRLDAGSSSNTRFNRMFMQFNASNRGALFETGQMYTDEDDKMGVSGSMVMDMDANDTVTMRVFASRNGASGGTTTSGHNSEPVTFFSGFLLG